MNLINSPHANSVGVSIISFLRPHFLMHYSPRYLQSLIDKYSMKLQLVTLPNIRKIGKTIRSSDVISFEGPWSPYGPIGRFKRWTRNQLDFPCLVGNDLIFGFPGTHKRLLRDAKQSFPEAIPIATRLPESVVEIAKGTVLNQLVESRSLICHDSWHMRELASGGKALDCNQIKLERFHEKCLNEHGDRVQIIHFQTRSPDEYSAFLHHRENCLLGRFLAMSFEVNPAVPCIVELPPPIIKGFPLGDSLRLVRDTIQEIRSRYSV